ncbi:MAG: UDP-N-acetylmuramoyl-L-alanine--D-glutamate ligase [Actinobacteria bacterium]|nr:UDP-N-acetylmuramoyl-L-alanine--D-glutamate ligase [Actinomycetota bacterium]
MKNKNILVLGLAKSGISVIKKLALLPVSVLGMDSNPCIDIESNFKEIKKTKSFKLEIKLDEKINENTDIIKGIDLTIVSPGIPNNIAIIKEADKRGIPIWSEIEFAWKLMPDQSKKKTIGVTGTNGKTTVVTLIEKILAESGREAVACGNIGNPLINTIDCGYSKNAIRVIEISSFQLERIYTFKPHVAVLLNITNDHMDRHYTMDNYADIKFKIFSNLDGSDWGIFNVDDILINKKLKEKNYYCQSNLNIIKYGFNKSNRQTGDNFIYYKDNNIYYEIKGNAGKIDISKMNLIGEHNILNIMACLGSAKIFNVDDASIEKNVKNFKTLQHRIEFIEIVNGIRCFNDSKATNPDSTIKALSSFNKEVTLILGGKDKEMDFSALLAYLNDTVLNLILIGETKNKILNLIKKQKETGYEVYLCNSLEEAVNKGFEVTEPGDVFLLSPACASFDMFSDYKDRGRKFKNLILKRKNNG